MDKYNPKELLRRFTELESIRRPYETVWDEITQLCLPNRGGRFNNEGDSVRIEELYDDTGALSAEYLTSTILGGLVNPEIKWFGLKPAGELYGMPDQLHGMLSMRNHILYSIFRDSNSGFYTNLSEFFLELVTLGTAGLEVFYEPAEGIKFRTVRLESLYVSTNKAGKVDTVFRKYRVKARHLLEMFDEGKLPKAMIDKAKMKPEEMVTLIRCVKPSDYYKAGARDNYKWDSMYICKDSGHMLAETQLDHFPYVIARWNKLADEDYGRSPAWSALADMNMVQAMEYSMLEMGQKMAAPPLMVADDGVLLPLDTQANGLIVGGIDPITGRPRVAPLQMGASMPIFEGMLERKKEAIRRAFYNNALFMQNRPQMTAEEVITLREEGFRLMSANVYRIIEEVLTPLVLTTYHLAQKFKLLPPVDEEGKQFDLGIPLEVEFMGALARTAKLNDAMAWNRYVQQFLVPLAQIDPTALDILSIDRSAEMLADSLNVPMVALASPDERMQIRQARAQQQQAQFELQATEQQAKIMALTKGEEQDDGEL